MLQIFYCWIWVLFVDLWSFKSTKDMRHRAVWYAIPMVLELVAILVNLCTGWIFVINVVDVEQPESCVSMDGYTSIVVTISIQLVLLKL